MLLQNNDDPGNQRDPGFWSVRWPAGSPNPLIRTQGLSAPLLDNNTFGPYVTDSGRTLRDLGSILATPKSLERRDAARHSLWSAKDGTIWLPALDALSADEKRYYRCDRDGLVRCFDVATGRAIWDFKMPFNAVLQPAGDELVAGANNGAIVRLSATGQPLWQTRLREHHEAPAGDYGAYIAAARQRDVDSSPEFFPAGQDGPDDYKGVLRMGIEQLVNGSFESAEHWQSEKGTVTTNAPGKEGASSLQLADGQLVTQRLTGGRSLPPPISWSSGIGYKSPRRSSSPGVCSTDRSRPSPVPSLERARASGLSAGSPSKPSYDTKTIDVGFEAEGGAGPSVDAASLRAIRFPSANLLANAEVQAVEQTYVKDIRVHLVRPHSRRLLREKSDDAQSRLGLRPGGHFHRDDLHPGGRVLANGKLDDVGSTWTMRPTRWPFPHAHQAEFISHLVLYLTTRSPTTSTSGLQHPGEQPRIQGCLRTWRSSA